jgi:hypothetical protein
LRAALSPININLYFKIFWTMSTAQSDMCHQCFLDRCHRVIPHRHPVCR